MRTKWILIIAGVVGVLLVVAVVSAWVLVSRYDFNELKPKASQAVMNATGRELTMEGDIELKVGLTPTLVVNGVSFQNAPWGSRPHMAAVKRLEVQVALIPLIRGNIEVKRLALIEPDIIIETNSSGASNFAFEAERDRMEPGEKKEPSAEREMPALSFDNVLVENAVLTFRDGQTGKTHAASIERLTAVEQRNERLEVAAHGTYNGMPVEISGTLGPLSALTDSQKQWPIELTAETQDAAVTVDGSIKDAMNGKGMDLHVVVEGQSIAAIAGIAGVAGVPDMGPLKLAGRLTDPSTGTYRFSELDARLAESDVSGWAEVTLGDQRPRVHAELSAQTLDLRAFASGEDGAGTEATPARESPSRSDKVFSEERFPLNLLHMVDGEVTIQAEQILLPRVSLKSLTTKVTLEDGSVRLQPVQAIVSEGSLNGDALLAARGDVLELEMSLKVEDLNVGLLLKELKGNEVFEGILDADIQLAGRGISLADLMAQLNGTTVVIMGGGRINNKYVNVLGADVGSEMLRLLNPLAERKDYTEINCCVSRFDIVNGSADSTALVVDTTELTVVGEGTIDLGTEKLNLSLKPSPKKGVGATDSALPTLSLGELTKPFKLGGTLAHPKLAIDPSGTAIILGKAAAGTAVFGPAGIVAALATPGGTTDENPCLAAIEAAETGVKVGAEEKGMAEDVTDATKTAVGEAQRQIKKLFGR